MQVCRFQIGTAQCAVPLASVREVALMPSLRALPKATALVEGLVVVRGEPVPVLRIAHVLGLAQRQLDQRDHLLVLQAGPRLVGLRVDEVYGLDRLSAGDVVPVPTPVPGAPHMVGLTRCVNDLLFLHDPARFLGDAEAAAVDRWLSECASA